MFSPFAFMGTKEAGTDPDAQAFIDATGISGTDATAINDLVVGLKADNTWNKFKVIYPMVGGTATTMKYNLVDPQDTDAAYRITYNGTNTFDSNGVTFGGTTLDYGNCHIILSGSAFTLNSGHLSIYNRTAGANGAFFGARDTSGTTNSSTILINDLSSSFSGYCGPSLANRGTVSKSQGFIVVSRTGSAYEETSIDGTVELIYTGASTALTELEFYIGARNFNNVVSLPTPYNCAFASAGDELSASEVASVYTRVQDFQTTLGRQV